jgi:hypothetical protein
MSILAALTGEREALHVAPDRLQHRDIAAVEPWALGQQVREDLLFLGDALGIGATHSGKDEDRIALGVLCLVGRGACQTLALSGGIGIGAERIGLAVVRVWALIVLRYRAVGVSGAGPVKRTTGSASRYKSVRAQRSQVPWG